MGNHRKQMIKNNVALIYFFSALGLPAPRFMDVLWVLNSLEKGMKSGAPGRYFRKGSGILNP
jgi:hypothetical protein